MNNPRGVYLAHVGEAPASYVIDGDEVATNYGNFPGA